MTIADVAALLVAAAAVISAIGVPITAIIAARSLAASGKNALAIAAIAIDVKETAVHVNGNLKEFTNVLKEKNILDKAVSYTTGATDQRDAAPGVVVTTAPDAVVTAAAETPPHAADAAPVPPQRPDRWGNQTE